MLLHLSPFSALHLSFMTFPYICTFLTFLSFLLTIPTLFHFKTSFPLFVSAQTLSLLFLCVIIFKYLQPACLKHHQNSFGLRCFAPLHMHCVLIVIEMMLNCQFASRIWLVLQDSKIISHLKRVSLFTYHSLNDLTVFFLTYLPFVLYLFFIFSILNIYLLISTSTWAFSSYLVSLCFTSQSLLLTLLYSSFCFFLFAPITYVFYLRYFCFSSLHIFFPHFSSLLIYPPPSPLFFILAHLFPSSGFHSFAFLHSLHFSTLPTPSSVFHPCRSLSSFSKIIFCLFQFC